MKCFLHGLTVGLQVAMHGGPQRKGRKRSIVPLPNMRAAQHYQSRARCANACCHTFDTTLSLSRRSFGVLKILCTGRSLRCLGGGAQNYTRCVAHSRSPCVVRSSACVRARFNRALDARTLAVTPSTPPFLCRVVASVFSKFYALVGRCGASVVVLRTTHVA